MSVEKALIPDGQGKHQVLCTVELVTFSWKHFKIYWEFSYENEIGTNAKCDTCSVQWWNVTKYIHSSSVLKYELKFDSKASIIPF